MILFPEYVTPSSRIPSNRLPSGRSTVVYTDLISRTRLVDIIRHDSFLDCLSRQDSSAGRKIQRIMMADEHGVDGKVKG